MANPPKHGKQPEQSVSQSGKAARDEFGDVPRRNTSRPSLEIPAPQTSPSLRAHLAEEHEPATASPPPPPRTKTTSLREATAPTKSAAPAAAKKPTAHQNKANQSEFQDMSKQRAQQALLGAAAQKANPFDDDEEPTKLGLSFDGSAPAPGLEGRDVWRTLHAPLQSREGRRNLTLYQNVINQFAVEHNPRYEPDADRSRAHIFVWDLSRAMNCELPHFMGNRELSLRQTCDWVRSESHARGWKKLATAAAAIDAALKGQLVVAIPKEVTIAQLGVVFPSRAGDASPLIAAAALQRGSKLKLKEALGVTAAEFFTHL